MTETRKCATDPAAYVLGTLSRPDVEAFRLHLMRCPECRAEVAELEDALAVVPMMATRSAAATGPVVRPRGYEVERRSAARERAEEALEADDPSDLPVTVRPVRPGPMSVWADEDARGRARKTVRVLGVRMSRPALTGLLALVAATVLTLALTFVTSGTNVYPAEIAWRPGAALLEIANEQGTLLVSGMPRASRAHIYEVWVERGDEAPSPTAALFDVSVRHRARVRIPGSMQDVTAVLVTEEPRGGSAAPTTEPLLVALVH